MQEDSLTLNQYVSFIKLRMYELKLKQFKANSFLQADNEWNTLPIYLSIIYCIKGAVYIENLEKKVGKWLSLE